MAKAFKWVGEMGNFGNGVLQPMYTLEGIPARDLERVFERFYRVDRARSRDTGGTGLGLAIVKHALGRHGATLHISSHPGQGSTFSARFAGPRVRPRQSA